MTIEIVPRAYTHPDVVRLVDEVQAEYVVMYGGPDEAVVDPADFVAPQGHFVVALDDDEPVAMGGWRLRADLPGPAVEAELKRMYVRPGARRRGLARLVLGELERSAAEAGVDRMVLNTGPEQPEALELYRVNGYQPAPGFGHYADVDGAIFLGKNLSRG